jgi:hypothetical protein
MYSISSRLQHEVAGLAGVASSGDAAVFVELHVGLGDGVLVFFPGRKIVAVGFVLGGCFLAPASALAFSILARATMSPTLNAVSPGFRILTSSTTAPLITRGTGFR